MSVETFDPAPIPAAPSRLRAWGDAVRAFAQPRNVAMLFLGFSAGVPILLIFSTLGIWLREAGVERSTVTMFSWAALGYSFKFVWAPLIDRLPVPVLTRLMGRRRGWILSAQLAIAGAIAWMALTDPSQGYDALVMMAFATVLLGFSSATQDVVIDAYRIEVADPKLQGLLSATYIAGYRIGMLVAGAGSLYLADFFGTAMGAYDHDAWAKVYGAMAAVMGVGIATTLLIREPEVDPDAIPDEYSTRDYLGFLALFVVAIAAFVATFWTAGGLVDGFAGAALRFALATAAAFATGWALLRTGITNRELVVSSYVAPVREFFSRYSASVALVLLAVVGLYRISDIVIGIISNVFFVDLGYTKSEIATVVKTFGLFMTLGGGFVGGVISLRYGVMRTLMLGAILTVATNLLFVLLAWSGRDVLMLYVVISADNLTAGIASAAFIAFLSALTNVKFTAVQYAIFSSMMTLVPKLIGGYSGTMVDSFGYVNFFILGSAMGLPVLWLVWRSGKVLKLD